MMDYLTFVFWGTLVCIGLFVLFVIYIFVRDWLYIAMMSDKEKASYKKRMRDNMQSHAWLSHTVDALAIKQSKEISEKSLIYGVVKPSIICPQCHKKGVVHTNPFDKKNGISGAKATGAILTGGISLLFTGLSRTENVTQAHCNNCNTDWMF
jgi:hypothetical protein